MALHTIRCSCTAHLISNEENHISECVARLPLVLGHFWVHTNVRLEPDARIDEIFSQDFVLIGLIGISGLGLLAFQGCGFRAFKAFSSGFYSLELNYRLDLTDVYALLGFRVKGPGSHGGLGPRAVGSKYFQSCGGKALN